MEAEDYFKDKMSIECVGGGEGEGLSTDFHDRIFKCLIMAYCTIHNDAMVAMQ
jgi:hypothetical protein